MRTRPLAVVALALAAAGCGASTTASAPTQPSPGATMATAYLDTMIATMAANSVHRGRINWPDFSARVRAAAPGAQTIAETAPAIRTALDLLGDRHSFFEWSGGRAIANPDAPFCASSSGAMALSADVANLPGDIGYVPVPALFGAGAMSPTAYADALQSLIRAQDRPDLAGWIVDLRGNSGGNMWPMIAGVGPLLGAGTAGFFVAPGRPARPWGYDGSRAYFSATGQHRVARPYVVDGDAARVAVLTDGGTASSGEAIAIAFRGRADSRSFGAATCGVPTSNTPYTFSDGATLWLTTSFGADRLLRQYDGPIQPDETIADAVALFARASAWLRER